MPLYLSIARQPQRCLTSAAQELRRGRIVWAKVTGSQVVQRPDERVTQLMEVENEATGQVSDLRSEALPDAAMQSFQKLQGYHACGLSIRLGEVSSKQVLPKNQKIE